MGQRTEYNREYYRSHKEYHASYKKKHRERYLVLNREWKRRNKWKDKRKIFLREHINRAKTKPCVDCGKQYNPWVMQFDHRPEELKKFCIAEVMSRKMYTIEEVNSEIAKCDVVCANCHAERTYKRKDWNRNKNRTALVEPKKESQLGFNW
jgi:hypothetical protein